MVRIGTPVIKHQDPPPHRLGRRYLSTFDLSHACFVQDNPTPLLNLGLRKSAALTVWHEEASDPATGVLSRGAKDHLCRV